MSTSHFVAETYPYRPGTIIRTGKPWAIGSGLPVHRDREHRVAAVHGHRRRRSDGEPVDRSRDDLVGAGVDAGLFEQIGFSGAPIHRALPMYGPPTSFETHVSVMSRSMSARDSQLLEVKLHLAIDHAVDPSVARPRRRRAGR